MTFGTVTGHDCPVRHRRALPGIDMSTRPLLRRLPRAHRRRHKAAAVPAAGRVHLLLSLHPLQRPDDPRGSALVAGEHHPGRPAHPPRGVRPGLAADRRHRRVRRRRRRTRGWTGSAWCSDRLRAGAGRVRADPAPGGRLLERAGPQVGGRGDLRRSCSPALLLTGYVPLGVVPSEETRWGLVAVIVGERAGVLVVTAQGQGLDRACSASWCPALSWIGAIRLARPAQPLGALAVPRAPAADQGPRAPA